MGPTTPEDVDLRFAKAFNDHDLDALLDLYESDAVLVPQAGQRAIGRDAIRQALANFLATFDKIELTTRGKVEQGNLALLYSDFRLHGTGQDGQPVTLDGHGTEVVRRQEYGDWLFAIDDPFSTA